MWQEMAGWLPGYLIGFSVDSPPSADFFSSSLSSIIHGLGSKLEADV
jgi:hypothetical protein